MIVFSSVLALLVLCLAVSGESSVFADQVRSGESIDIDDFTFIITMNKYGSAIFVDAGEMFLTVPIFGCKKMDHFRVCFDNTTFDLDENELFAEVRINRSEPDVTITRQINQTNDLYVGQEAEMTINIINTGDPASQIIMRDDYPQGIEIYDMAGGCQVHENEVYWQGHLDEDETKTCTFIIRARKEIHQSISAHLEYWDGFKWEDDYSSALSLDFDPVIEFFSSVVREDYEVEGTTFDFDEEVAGVNIGETPRLIINLSNNYNEDVYIKKLEITLPPDIEYKSISHLRFNYRNSSGDRTSNVWYSDRISRITKNVLRWSGNIDDQRSKLFIVKLHATKSGHQNVIMRVAYEYDGLEFDDVRYADFDVVDPGVAIRMSVSDKSKRFSAPERLNEEDDSIDIEALHPYHFTVYTQNRNKYSYLTDVKVKVFTELAGFPQVNYDVIDEGGQKIPYSTEIIPPNNPASKDFKMNVSVWSKNSFGESHFNSTEFTVTVSPTKDLSIEYDSSEGEVLESGEETEVTVGVKNDRLIDIHDVRITDTIDPRLHVEGVHSKKVKLLAEEDTQVYLYRLTMPRVHKTTYYNITTKVSFFDPDIRHTFNYTKITTFAVKPLKPDLDVDLDYDTPDKIYPGTLIPVDYTIGNPSDTEVVRDITVYLPLMAEVDFIGPRTFFIDKLDPGEDFEIKDLVKARPKVVRDNIKIDKTYVEYYDAYGNLFNENSTEETFDVDSSSIVGPAIFLRTLDPGVMNKSSDGVIRIEVTNNGSAATDVTITQDSFVINTSVGAHSTSIASYIVRYDTEGNYTLPDPVATYTFQGITASTKGDGAEVRVKLLLGPLQEDVKEETPVEPEKKADASEAEKEEISFEEYDEGETRRFMSKVFRVAFIVVVAFVVFMLVLLYVGYQKRKAMEAPFVHGEESEEEQAAEMAVQSEENKAETK
ncbi:hypothetical protein ACFL3V_02895 [Nanoarchaeota archaeon]